MKKLVLSALVAAFTGIVSAQSPITITSADMPVLNDTLRWSSSDALGSGINLTQTGANTTWDFSSQVALTQGLDHYQTALQVNVLYAAALGSLNCYGYKVLDSIPGIPPIIPISPKDLYTFFNKKTNPSRYVAEGFAATISGLPIPAAYTDEDEIYLFPLTYPHTQDSTTFKLKATIPMLGAFGQQGYRKTTVDGWGTIMTPFTTSPVPVIRVRSEVVEIDSVTFAGVSLGLPRTTVEYRWLASGQHYPMMDVTAAKTGNTETINSVRYRDSKRSLAVAQVANNGITSLSVYPTPAAGGVLHIDVPAQITAFTISLWDVNGKLVQSAQNVRTLDVSALPRGQYVLRAESGAWQGFARVIR